MGQQQAKSQDQPRTSVEVETDPYWELAEGDMESDRESVSVGSRAKNLIESMWEYIHSLNATTQDLKTFGDNAARQGATGKLKVYFDIFSAKSGQESQLQSSDLELFKRLLKVCSRYTDASVPFSEAIASSGILSNLIDLLEIYKQSFHERIQTQGEIILDAISLLYNCSLSSNNKSFFQDMEAVELIGWYANNTRGLNINGDNSLSTCCMLILAHITDDGEKDIILTDRAIIDNIIENLDGALSSPELRSSLGFTAKQLARGLTELANNDENSRIIYKSGAIKRLMQLIDEGNVEDKVAAVKCIWALVFVDENRSLVKNNPKVVEKLKQIEEEGESELRHAAGGALWVLKDTESPGNSQTECLQEKGESPHVMISCSWDKRDMAVKLKEFLEGNSYRVWMNVDKMQGNTLDAMAAAVEQAAVVLMCLSQTYKENQSCRSEAEYAYKTGKPIIPLKMQKGYNPKGWLGIIVGVNMCYDFTNEEMFDESASRLLNEIGERGKE